MKILVNRSIALLLTLALLLTMTPFTVLAEAVEMNEGMDGAMDILETNEADDPQNHLRQVRLFRPPNRP